MERRESALSRTGYGIIEIRTVVPCLPNWRYTARWFSFLRHSVGMRGKNPYPNLALWVPTIWMMRCGSRNIDFWLGGSESGRWDPILIAILVICGLVVLSRRPCVWSSIFAHNSAIVVFYLYIAASLFWADAIDNPAVKIMRPFGDLVMATIVATETDPKLAIVTMFRRTAILLIPLSVVLIKYFPSLGRATDKHWGSDSWVGVTTHKNPLGQLCMVSSMAWLWTVEDYKKE